MASRASIGEHPIHPLAHWRGWIIHRWIPWWGTGFQTRRRGRRPDQRGTKNRNNESRAGGVEKHFDKSSYEQS